MLGRVPHRRPLAAFLKKCPRGLLTDDRESVSSTRMRRARTIAARQRVLDRLPVTGELLRGSLLMRTGRVEEGRGGLSHWQSLRLPSPLIEPDVRISRIRLSDRLHDKAHGGGVRASLRNRTTPSLPKMFSSENRLIPSDGTL